MSLFNRVVAWLAGDENLAAYRETLAATWRAQIGVDKSTISRRRERKFSGAELGGNRRAPTIPVAMRR